MYLLILFVYVYIDKDEKGALQENVVICPRPCGSYVNKFGIRVQVSDCKAHAPFILLQLLPALTTRKHLPSCSEDEKILSGINGRRALSCSLTRPQSAHAVPLWQALIH